MMPRLACPTCGYILVCARGGTFTVPSHPDWMAARDCPATGTTAVAWDASLNGIHATTRATPTPPAGPPPDAVPDAVRAPRAMRPRLNAS